MIETDFTCDDCQRSIPDGEKMWSLTLEHDAFERGAMQVYDAVSLYFWCETCAANRDFKKIVVPEKA